MAAECGLNRCYHHRRDNTTDSTRLLASKAECIITADVLAPAVDSIASKCQFLKTNLIVSESSRAKCLNFSDLLEYPVTTPQLPATCWYSMTSPDATHLLQVTVPCLFMLLPGSLTMISASPYSHLNSQSGGNSVLEAVAVRRLSHFFSAAETGNDMCKYERNED
ncbi:uncharacterized protein LOC142062562 isoform X2 [Phalacrocorax aristotelis]|uniref:uncharacterized protein LOC142062562 isoform X2 n=1 Tax=Phalacrocorax aristotelis TaxID=126867 RepID=UPI003F4B59B3